MSAAERPALPHSVSTLDPPKRTTAERVRALMQRRDESLRDVATACGFSPTALHKIVHGANPTLETVTKLAVHFRVSIDFLAGLTEQENPEHP